MINKWLDESATADTAGQYRDVRTCKGRWMEGLWGRSRILALVLTVPFLAVGVRAERHAPQQRSHCRMGQKTTI